MEVSANKDKVKIHFDGWDEEWDEWIEITSERLAQINSVITDNNDINNSFYLKSPKRRIRTLNSENTVPVDLNHVLIVGARVDARDRFDMLSVTLYFIGQQIFTPPFCTLCS